MQQQQVLDAIAQRDSQGNDILQLSATLEKSEEFRADMRKAVNESIQTEGDVVIHNKMPSGQRIKVNQTQYDIPAGETLTLKVPVGTLTAQLPGQRLTNWTISAPQYKQTIDIVPDTEATVTTYRPLYTEPAVPVYVTPIERSTLIRCPYMSSPRLPGTVGRFENDHVPGPSCLVAQCCQSCCSWTTSRMP